MPKKKPDYGTLITVLKRKKDEAVGYVAKVVSDPDDLGAAAAAAANFAKKQFEGMSIDTPGYIAGKIGYSNSPGTKYENYRAEVLEEIGTIEGADQRQAVIATIDAVIADLEDY